MSIKYTVAYLSKTKKKAMDFIEYELKQNGIYDLIPTHGNVLSVLYENNGKLPMKDIAKLIGRDKSTVTPLISKLEKLGYVKKEKSEIDKRVTYIVLTQKGKSIEDIFKSTSKKLIETAYKGFTKEEEEIFLRLLKKLNNNFGTLKKDDTSEE